MMLLRSVALLAVLSSCATAFVVPGNSRPQDVSLCATAKDIESIRKKEFVALMASELGYSKTEAEAALLCTLEIISGSLVDGKKIVFPGFGTFEPRTRSARKGRNPKTGEEIQIKASVGAGFSAAKGLKDKLNGRE